MDGPEHRPRPERRQRASMASQTDSSEEPPTSPPGIPEVMAGIASCHSAIALCIATRLTTAEGRIGHVEDTVAAHDGAIRTLQSKMKSLEYRAEEAENR